MSPGSAQAKTPPTLGDAAEKWRRAMERARDKPLKRVVEKQGCACCRNGHNVKLLRALPTEVAAVKCKLCSGEHLVLDEDANLGVDR